MPVGCVGGDGLVVFVEDEAVGAVVRTVVDFGFWLQASGHPLADHLEAFGFFGQLGA